MLDIKKIVESEGLYRTSLPFGGSFTWRLLTLKEYNAFASLKDSGTINDYEFYTKVFEYCFVGNPLLIDGSMPMGIIFGIGRLIIDLSGHKDAEQEKTELEIARQNYPRNTLLEYMKRVILRTFSTYTPEIIENWTREKILERFVLAESVLADATGYTPISMDNILSPQEAKKKAKKKEKIDFEKENRALEKSLGKNGQHFVENTPTDPEYEKRLRIAKAMGGR
jgi:hypothetical protein